MYLYILIYYYIWYKCMFIRAARISFHISVQTSLHLVASCRCSNWCSNITIVLYPRACLLQLLQAKTPKRRRRQRSRRFLTARPNYSGRRWYLFNSQIYYYGLRECTWLVVWFQTQTYNFIWNLLFFKDYKIKIRNRNQFNWFEFIICC